MAGLLALLSLIAACQAPAGPGAGGTPSPASDATASPAPSPTGAEEGGADDYGAEPGY